MPHRRKATQPSTVRLRAHRIPPTVLRSSQPSTEVSPLPVLDPSSSGVIPAATVNRKPSKHVSVPSLPSSKAATFAIVVIAALALIAVASLNPFATPPAGQAYSALSFENPSPHAETSTPTALWKQGTVPHLYNDDGDWADIPYGTSTIGLTGSPATAVAMARVSVTGADDVTPIEVAKWANENNVATTSHDAIEAVVTNGAENFGLKVTPLELTAIAVRRSVASGNPVVAILKQGTVEPVETVVVITGIDQNSMLEVNDPTSSESTATPWGFDKVLDNARGLYAYTAA